MASPDHPSAADLLRLPSIAAHGLAVLDGGFATHLEDALGHDISSSPLWSASLLQSDAGCRAIVQTHLDFLDAGAQLISTSTYQASLLSFAQAGLSAETARQLIVRSVALAEEARQLHLSTHSDSKGDAHHPSPLIALSLGPYGAALSNGAEYTGQYSVPSGAEERPPSEEELCIFHLERLEAVAAHPSAWQSIDVLAFETIPRIDEVKAVRRALDRLYAAQDVPLKVAYASFVLPNGVSLPFPVAHDRQHETSMAAMVESVFAPASGLASLHGIGINCTKPYFLDKLVQTLTTVVQASALASRPYLFLYPDGGLVWDGIERVWKAADKADGTSTWSEELLRAARPASTASATWAGCFVGGCCKATTEDVASLRRAIADAEEPFDSSS